MSRPRGQPPSGPGSPDELPQGSPRDLHPTSDIRFVMVEIGKLTSTVDGLVKSVDKHGDKLDDITGKVDFLKGAAWVIGGILTILVIAIGWYFAGKLNISVTPPK